MVVGWVRVAAGVGAEELAGMGAEELEGIGAEELDGVGAGAGLWTVVAGMVIGASWKTGNVKGKPAGNWMACTVGGCTACAWAAPVGIRLEKLETAGWRTGRRGCRTVGL